MDRLPTRVDRSGQDWRRKEQIPTLAADLKERLEAVKQGGGGSMSRGIALEERCFRESNCRNL